MEKNEEKCKEVEKYAKLLKVCGHPIRLKILLALEDGKETCVKDLANCIGQPQPIISQHLAVLKKLEIVCSQNEKTTHRYYICNLFVKRLISQILAS